MKITKDYLKQVIKEELNNLEEAEGEIPRPSQPAVEEPGSQFIHPLRVHIEWAADYLLEYADLLKTSKDPEEKEKARDLSSRARSMKNMLPNVKITNK